MFSKFFPYSIYYFKPPTLFLEKKRSFILKAMQLSCKSLQALNNAFVCQNYMKCLSIFNRSFIIRRIITTFVIFRKRQKHKEKSQKFQGMEKRKQRKEKRRREEEDHPLQNLDPLPLPRSNHRTIVYSIYLKLYHVHKYIVELFMRFRLCWWYYKKYISMLTNLLLLIYLSTNCKANF